MDAVAAAGPLGQLGGHHVGDGADADLQGGAVGHVGAGLLGDGLVDLVRLGLGQGERGAVGLDQDVHQFERDGVGVVRPERRRPGQVGVDLDHEEPVGVLARQEELLVGGTDVERQVDGAVEWGRGEHGHDAWVVPAQDGGELPEAARHQFDVGPGGQEHPLGRTEESAAVEHVGMGQELVVAEEQGAADGQLDPVVTSAERRQERIGVGRAEAESHRVRGADQGGCLVGRAGLWCHGDSVAPAPRGGEGPRSQLVTVARRPPRRRRPPGDASMCPCGSTPSSPASRTHRSTPVVWRPSVSTGPSPSRAPTTSSPR